MHRLDDGKIVLGGLAAGLVLFAGSLLPGRIAGTEVVVAIAGGPAGRAMAPMELWGFLWAHLLVGGVVSWVTAAVVPFYGAGPRGAIRAGLAVWIVAMVAPMAFQVVLGVVRPGLEGGSMLAAMAISAGLFAAAGMAAAVPRSLTAARGPAPEPAAGRS